MRHYTKIIIITPHQKRPLYLKSSTTLTSVHDIKIKIRKRYHYNIKILATSDFYEMDDKMDVCGLSCVKVLDKKYRNEDFYYAFDKCFVRMYKWSIEDGYNEVMKWITGNGVCGRCRMYCERKKGIGCGGGKADGELDERSDIGCGSNGKGMAAGFCDRNSRMNNACEELKDNLDRDIEKRVLDNQSSGNSRMNNACEVTKDSLDRDIEKRVYDNGGPGNSMMNNACEELKDNLDRNIEKRVYDNQGIDIHFKKTEFKNVSKNSNHNNIKMVLEDVEKYLKENKTDNAAQSINNKKEILQEEKDNNGKIDLKCEQNNKLKEILPEEKDNNDKIDLKCEQNNKLKEILPEESDKDDNYTKKICTKEIFLRRKSNIEAKTNKKEDLNVSDEDNLKHKIKEVKTINLSEEKKIENGDKIDKIRICDVDINKLEKKTNDKKDIRQSSRDESYINEHTKNNIIDKIKNKDKTPIENDVHSSRESEKKKNKDYKMHNNENDLKMGRKKTQNIENESTANNENDIKCDKIKMKEFKSVKDKDIDNYEEDVKNKNKRIKFENIDNGADKYTEKNNKQDNQHNKNKDEDKYNPKIDISKKKGKKHVKNEDIYNDTNKDIEKNQHVKNDHKNSDDKFDVEIDNSNKKEKNHLKDEDIYNDASKDWSKKKGKKHNKNEDVSNDDNKIDVKIDVSGKKEKKQNKNEDIDHDVKTNNKLDISKKKNKNQHVQNQDIDHDANKDIEKINKQKKLNKNEDIVDNDLNRNSHMDKNKMKEKQNSTNDIKLDTNTKNDKINNIDQENGPNDNKNKEEEGFENFINEDRHIIKIVNDKNKDYNHFNNEIRSSEHIQTDNIKKEDIIIIENKEEKIKTAHITNKNESNHNPISDSNVEEFKKVSSSSIRSKKKKITKERGYNTNTEEKLSFLENDSYPHQKEINKKSMYDKNIPEKRVKIQVEDKINEPIKRQKTNISKYDDLLSIPYSIAKKGDSKITVSSLGHKKLQKLDLKQKEKMNNDINENINITSSTQNKIEKNINNKNEDGCYLSPRTTNVSPVLLTGKDEPMIKDTIRIDNTQKVLAVDIQKIEVEHSNKETKFLDSNKKENIELSDNLTPQVLKKTDESTNKNVLNIALRNKEFKKVKLPIIIEKKELDFNGDYAMKPFKTKKKNFYEDL